MNQGKVILLNGTSSSGKSTLAKALQEALDEPFLHVDGDFFWQLYPERFFAAKSDAEYQPWRRQFLPACYRTIATFADDGLNVIVDEVLTKPMTLTWLQKALADIDVVFVGLHCNLIELERRERLRGNRKLGLARFQFPNIHIHGSYDIEVHTDVDNPQACALQIKQQMALGRTFDSFRQAKERPLPS
ncbi:MAG: AAA family ATPase [Chloroflexota bacterium]